MALMDITVTSPEQTETSNTAAHFAVSRYSITPRKMLTNASAIADFRRLLFITATIAKTSINPKQIVIITSMFPPLYYTACF
jgi:hypothetical protein